MATRKIKIYGFNYDADSTATVLWDGAEVHNAAITQGVGVKYDQWSGDFENKAAAAPSTFGALIEFEYENADDTSETSHTLSIECTNGNFGVGNVYVNAGANALGYPEDQPQGITIAGDVYYSPGNNTGSYGDGTEGAQGERLNVLVDGAAQSISDWVFDEGVNDEWAGSSWIYELTETQTFTCSVRVLKTIDAYVAP